MRSYEQYHTSHGGNEQARKLNYTDMVSSVVKFGNYLPECVDRCISGERIVNLAMFNDEDVALIYPVLVSIQVNKYYDLATSFYEYGWGESFHFAHRSVDH